MANAYSVTLSTTLVASINDLPSADRQIMAALVRQLRLDGPHLLSGYAMGSFSMLSIVYVENGQAVGLDSAHGYLELPSKVLALKFTMHGDAGVRIEEG